MAGGDLRALRDRLRAATGADPLLDYDITRALWPLKILQAPPTTDREYYAPITASIDAALALCERKLPGWGFVLTTNDDGGFLFELCRNNAPGAGPDCEAPTAPLAILTALVEALIANEPSA